MIEFHMSNIELTDLVVSIRGLSSRIGRDLIGSLNQPVVTTERV